MLQEALRGTGEGMLIWGLYIHFIYIHFSSVLVSFAPPTHLRFVTERIQDV